MESKLEKYTSLIKTALDKAKENDVYAVLRLQDNKSVVVEVVDGMTENKTSTTSKGIGISAFTTDGAIGFASTSRLDEESVKKAVDVSSNLAKNSSKYNTLKKNKEIFDVAALKGVFLQKVDYNMSSKTSDEIENVVTQVNKWTKNLDSRLSVRTIYECVEDERRIVRSDGSDVTFNTPRSRVLSYLILKENQKVSQAIIKTQGVDYGVILDDGLRHVYDKRARSTAKLVSNLLNAGTIKGGHYKSLLSNLFIGLYAHEAVGHAFETDGFKSSVIASDGKLRKDEKVAPDNISFIDGPVEGIFGNQFISANGTQRKTVEFIKNGVISDALSDIFTAKEAGVEANGCERAENYSSCPIPRMSVTRMVDSNPIPFDKKCLEDITLDEIYELLVKHGELKPGESIVYPVGGMGGQVNPAEGNFVFNCAGIYLIENPKKITLYRQSMFSGNTLKTIATRAKGVGPVVLDDSGTCGKAHQGAPVSDGGNLLFVIDNSDYITFGGE